MPLKRLLKVFQRRCLKTCETPLTSFSKAFKGIVKQAHGREQQMGLRPSLAQRALGPSPRPCPQGPRAQNSLSLALAKNDLFPALGEIFKGFIALLPG